jgi:hypothetical protein
VYQIAGEEQLEVVRKLTGDKRQLEEELKLKLETSERNLEQVRANELQELRRGKVEALQVLQVCWDFYRYFRFFDTALQQ